MNQLLPKKVFVTTGKGESNTSEINAFDRALIYAGIGELNLVKVSSILPENCKEISPIKIKPGTITFTVLSRCDGKRGERISAGIGFAFLKDNKEFGMVAEDSGNKSEEEVEKELRNKLQEMASSRKMEIERMKIKTSSLTVDLEFGCVIAALIYLS